jgi:hypothetical protein
MADELLTGTALSLAEEAFAARMEAEHRLAAARRVAAEAMRLLTREQLAELRHALDQLDSSRGLPAELRPCQQPG